MTSVTVEGLPLRLGAEIEAIRSVAARFAAQEVAPRAAELDRTGAFPYDLVRRMGELGFFGMLLPEQYEGSNLGFLAYAVVVEEIAAAESGVSINITDQVLTASCIANFGDAEARRTWLPPMARGEILGAFGLTEPESGSDSGALRTTARLEGEEWVINGSKQFITNVGTDLSKLIVVLARAEMNGQNVGTTMFLVPLDAKGIEIGAPYRKMGWRCSNTQPISFDGCRIPRKNMMGEPGRGLKGMLTMLNGGRIGVAANATGIARACLDFSIDYAQTRRQFGSALANFQAIQFKIAEMATKVELSRLITHQAAKLADSGQQCTKEASMAKFFASRSAKEAADEAVQIAGGSGFMEDHPANRYWRTVKVLEIGEGTNEIQRILIARELLDLRD